MKLITIIKIDSINEVFNKLEKLEKIVIFHSSGWILRLSICEIILFIQKYLFIAILILNDPKINCSF